MSGLVLRRSVSFIELVDSCRSIPELVAACKILEQIWNAVEHLKLNQEQCKILRARCIYIFTVIRDNTQTLERPMRNRIIEEFTSVIKEINRLVNEWVNWALAKCIFHIDTSTTEIQRAMNQLDSYCQNFRTITQVQLSDLKTQMETAYEVDKIELERIVNSHREARGKVSEGLNALLMSMTAHSGGQSSAVAVISKQTTIQELVAHLISHGCQDLTGDIDFTAFGEYPVADGGFGNIYRGRLLNGTQVAVKTLRVFEAANEQNLRVLKHAAKEIHTWSKCRHSNVLGLLGLAIFRGRVGMVARWMNNGNLLRYLEKVPAANRCKLSADICEGLAYLHDIGIVHGDLKGTNVLISDDGVPLLTDFGNSLLEERTLQFTQSTDRGTLTMRWSAPELIMGSATHSKASDVYALGMTILETMTEAPPYNGKPERSIVYLVTYKRELPERPETHIPTNSDDGNKLWDLLVSCWSFEPEGRPSAEAVAQIMKTITQRGLIV